MLNCFQRQATLALVNLDRPHRIDHGSKQFGRIVSVTEPLKTPVHQRARPEPGDSVTR